MFELESRIPAENSKLENFNFKIVFSRKTRFQIYKFKNCKFENLTNSIFITKNRVSILREHFKIDIRKIRVF